MELTELKGVGPAVKIKLEKLNIKTQSDLLFLLPTRYEDRTFIKDIGSLVPDEEAQIEGTVLVCNIVYRGRRMLLVQLADETGILTLRFFTFSKYQAAGLKPNTTVRCFGKTRQAGSGVEMIHPSYQIIDNNNPSPLSKTLTPVYPTTKGLPQAKLRQIVSLGIQKQLKQTDELLPQIIVDEMGFGTLEEALIKIHKPNTRRVFMLPDRFSPLKRLVAEELIANQLALRRIKRTTQSNPAHAMTRGALIKELVERLPFTLTDSQERVVNEIKEDLRKPVPMMRLLQGDVGSGKTVVAALAMSMAADNKTQSVLMAPTELLAEQHLENLRGWFGPLGVKSVLLKSKLTQKERALILNEIKHGEVSIIVGTHALFQNKVEYKNLGLVVVDEQHRFGVDQRLSLVKKTGGNNAVPHQLIMTATPIPRTLAMTAYGDLDTSVLDELPKGRGEIKTIVVPDDKRSEVVKKNNPRNKRRKASLLGLPTH